MSDELKWAIAITLAGLLCLLLTHLNVLPRVAASYYGAVLLIGVVGLLHVAYRRVRNR